jgi:hypothetical protein
MADFQPIPIEDIRYQLLPDIVRLLLEVGNTSNLKVSTSDRVLDEEYLNKVKALITNVYLYVSSAKVTDDESTKKLLDGMLHELMEYDDYLRWNRVDYKVLMYILSRVVGILNSVTGTYNIKVNPYKEAYNPSERQRRNFKILG